jgi:crotonobetaine/carnitine-CoA ligase
MDGTGQNPAYRRALAKRYREIELAPLPANFSELIATAASKFGDSVAINAFETGECLSFNTLNERTNRLASSLSSLGIGFGTHVAVMLPNRIEYPLVWLALAKLGAVMLPTNTRNTSDELDFIYADGDARWLIVDTEFDDRLSGMRSSLRLFGTDRILRCGNGSTGPLSLDALIAAGDPDFVPGWPVRDEDLLNIQYTSGTTGMPKGCMQSQRFWLVLAATVRGMEGDFESVLADHPFFYIDPQWMMVYALMTGATVYMPDRMSVSRYVGWLHDNRIQFAYFAGPLLATAPTANENNLAIRKFTVGALSVDALRAGEARFNVPIRQNYGMTEIGAGLLVPNELEGDHMIGTLGLPAPYRKCRIVDENGETVSRGEIGELIVRGDSIFKGYYNRPDANIESFIGEWFRTGDLFRQDDKGLYRIVGRVKDMIRRSNENISALEVEQAFSAMPEIAEAAAVPVPDDVRGEEVKIFVRLGDGYSEIDVPPDALLDRASKRLASFKLPRFFAYVSDFPHTPSQKIAKSQLVGQVTDLRAGSWDRESEAWVA